MDNYILNAYLRSLHTESIADSVYSNIVDGIVYHASPLELDSLHQPFVTPFKGIAACFLVDKHAVLDALGLKVFSCNFSYDVWNWDVDSLREVPSRIQLGLNIPGDYVVSGVASGWMYSLSDLDYSRCKMFEQNPDSDVEFIVGYDVVPVARERCEVEWVCRFDPENCRRHGVGKYEQI